jgi:hypothetical protein
MLEALSARQNCVASALSYGRTIDTSVELVLWICQHNVVQVFQNRNYTHHDLKEGISDNFLFD